MKLDPKAFLNKISQFFQNLKDNLKTKLNFKKKTDSKDSVSTDSFDFDSSVSDDDIDSLLSQTSYETKSNGFIEKIKDLFYENKVLSIAFCSLLIVLLILLVILLAVSLKPAKEPEEIIEEDSYQLNYEYCNPYEEVLKSYTYSRELKDSWSAEESEEWFSVPDSNMLKTLEDKNNSNINDIFEVVP